MPQHEEPITELSHPEAAELAAALAAPGPAQRVFGELAQMEHRCRLAGRLIAALLRQTHGSDVFRLPPEE
jgi:hypothetical protein